MNDPLVDYRKVFETPYRCPTCNREFVGTNRLREHFQKKSGTCQIQRPEDLERELVQQRYPKLDIDDLIRGYLDREYGYICLWRRKILIKKFFKTIGIMRPHREDSQLRSRIRFKEVYSKKSLEEKFEGQYLQASVSRVINDIGLPELTEAVTALKRIKFAQRQEKKRLAEEAKLKGFT